ncbi:hypothetical protein UFOVP1064_52 [uncultured Caudovirales phage]|uniref:Uncharacterized protein n=1 Tax=uncultured Caudovirales phage TaxID=2100421 RepID=A0A6J5S9M3_9CAUD|nr:hypothetical protein UFOVP659_23 [uncultured Caudovirales phage]CAB4169299.1 hypothetical protein UFOVP885_2 [uncultured Caudovirales phage]CAB4181659.1 hypothetical protein UFOVP1064_52 [uncultured Caudovirales phage]CAB4189711.1 hypothetical protein UFOVP1197_11 [uncultured Caudovirales phage]CAB4195266.1 hypothetical protein UFOVP1294_5 [uncultured Caudovirales phage]|tara:strand:- start:3314 stop:3610 length:297 start_codon:yes stop_codon:yes gene_type:complete
MNSGAMEFPRDTPIVQVHTTSGRGFTPEELAVRCADKLMYVSDSAPPAIKEQARAFRQQIEKVVALYMHTAIANDRTTVYNALNDAGHPDLAELIRRI